MDNTDNDISFLRFQEISTLISKKNTTLSKTKYLLLETNNSIRTPKITCHSFNLKLFRLTLSICNHSIDLHLSIYITSSVGRIWYPAHKSMPGRTFVTWSHCLSLNRNLISRCHDKIYGIIL